jgi:site-specific DNA recombinase
MIAALYARVSTARQAEKELSIPDQLQQMRDWCERQGISVALEYQERGASATDDKRPVFQQMIAESCIKPSPVDFIIVHSLSRFFRDALEFGLYERQLNKHGVKVVSITQQTSDDPSGEMAKRIFSLFDEYQSKENGKHTLRAMKENARQGYFNGSVPPFGYCVVEVDLPGRHGNKKKLEVDLTEAMIVNKVFDLYTSGLKGKIFGMQPIANHLNQRGTSRRGSQWSKASVSNLLADTVYIGEHYFNKRYGKTNEVKPRDEWVMSKVPPITDRGTFDKVQQLRGARSPKNTPSRVVNSPTLLTGLLKCSCGASMTIATGKGGKYRYYKCTAKINLGKDTCNSGNLPMAKLDQLILQSVSEKVFTPDRVAVMLNEFRTNLQKTRSKHDDTLRQLKKELDAIQQATDRLFEAVEQGMLPVGQTLRERAHKHQTRRQEVLTEMAGLRRQKEMPLSQLSTKKIDAFCNALKQRLQDKDCNFGKEYLRLLVDEIKVDGKEVRLQGSYGAVAGLLNKSKAGSLKRVPTSGTSWLPELDSNYSDT